MMIGATSVAASEMLAATREVLAAIRWRRRVLELVQLELVQLGRGCGKLLPASAAQLVHLLLQLFLLVLVQAQLATYQIGRLAQGQATNL